MKRKTYIVIALDRSTSMSDRKAATIDGYNMLVREIKAAAEQEGEDINVSLLTFGSDLTEHFWNQKATQLQEADATTYVPHGMTVLHDAIGYTIDKLAQEPQGDDTAFIVHFITDGDNTAKLEYTPADAIAKLREYNAAKNWTLNFLGCSLESITGLSQQTGIAAGNMAAWTNQAADANVKMAFAGAAAGTAKMLRGRKAGVVKTANLYSDDGSYTDYSRSTTDAEVASYASANLIGTPVTADNVLLCSADNAANVFGVGQNINLSDVRATKLANTMQSASSPKDTGVTG